VPLPSLKDAAREKNRKSESSTILVYDKMVSSTEKGDRIIVASLGVEE
jgi:hypothetical protein